MPEQRIIQTGTVANYQHLADFLGLGSVVGNPQANVTVYAGAVSQTGGFHPSQIGAYTFIAEQLAIGLAHILSVLENYDKPAVYRIMSILDPYIEEIPELDFHIPPKSEREALMKVTREGRISPTILR